MIKFEEHLHDYQNGNLRAEVYSSEKGFGCRFFKDNLWVTDEVYEGHSEQYAEDAAENYVLGIKEL